MPTYKAHRIAVTSCMVAESPVWDPVSSTVTFVDSPRSRIYQIGFPRGELAVYELPIKVSAIALLSTGRFIAASNAGFALITISKGEVQVAFGLGPPLSAGWRMNDGACDWQGRFWSGSMAPDTSAPDGWGTLFSIDGAGGVVERGGRFRTQNGLAWSPDGRIMYVSDSHRNVPHVMAYDFDVARGTMSNGRLFADAALLGGRPDGAAIDAHGCYWIAASDSGRLLRLSPAGAIDAVIEVDVPNPTNLCFIGPDLDMVFITTLKADGVGPGGDVYLARLPHHGLAQPSFDGHSLPNLPQVGHGLRLADDTGAIFNSAE